MAPPTTLSGHDSDLDPPPRAPGHGTDVDPPPAPPEDYDSDGDTPPSSVVVVKPNGDMYIRRK